MRGLSSSTDTRGAQRSGSRQTPSRQGLHGVRRHADERAAVAQREGIRKAQVSKEDVTTGEKRKRTASMSHESGFAVPEGSGSDDENQGVTPKGPAKSTSPLAEKFNQRSMDRSGPASSVRNHGRVKEMDHPSKRVRLGQEIHQEGNRIPSRDAQPLKPALIYKSTASSPQSHGPRKTVTLKRCYGPPPGASFGLSDSLLDDSDSDIEVELDEQGMVPDNVPGVSLDEVDRMNHRLWEQAQREEAGKQRRARHGRVPSGSERRSQPENENVFARASLAAAGMNDGRKSDKRIDQGASATASSRSKASGTATRKPNATSAMPKTASAEKGSRVARPGSTAPKTPKAVQKPVLGTSPTSPPTSAPAWTQPPPPRPMPAHKPLPGSGSANGSDNEALARARSQAERYKPKQPSGLRTSSRLSSSPVTSRDPSVSSTALVKRADMTVGAATDADTVRDVVPSGPGIEIPEAVDGVQVDPQVREALMALPEDEFLGYYDFPALTPIADELMDYDLRTWNAVHRALRATDQTEAIEGFGEDFRVWQEQQEEGLAQPQTLLQITAS